MNNIDSEIHYLNTLAEDRDRWKKRNKYYHSAITKIFKFFVPENQNVIEIGCSTGDLLVALKPKKGLGVDLSSRAVAIAQEKHGENQNIEFRHDNAETFRENNTYEYVVISDTIGYLHDVQKTFENVHHVMKPDSRLVVNFYSFVWEIPIRIAAFFGLKKKQKPQNWLSNDDVVNLLHLADFEVIHREGFMLFPKYIPVVTEIFNGILAKLPVLRWFTVSQFIVARPRYIPSEEQTRNFTVSVIVPARNEAGNIEAAITRVPEMGKWTEFVLIEGHSQDNTWEVMQQVKEKYPDKRIKIMQQTGRGKKDAVYLGFEHAEGDILMILDSDLTMPPEDLPKYYDALVTNKGEFINGVRLVYPMEDKAMRFLNLYANKIFSLLFTYILGQSYKDTLCGTKVLFKKDWKKIKANRHYFGDFDPYGDFDLIFGSAKLCLKTVQMPIRYRERTYGEIQINRFSGGWLLLKMTVKGFIKFKWFLR